MDSVSSLSNITASSLSLSTDSTLLIENEIDFLAKEIFSFWDVEEDGVLTAKDILKIYGLDKEFAIALGNILGNEGSNITWKKLANCLRDLMYGDLKMKVLLLFRFMDVNNTGSITYNMVQSHLRIKDNKIYEKLGFITNGVKKNLEYNDIYLLFANSDRGVEAIDIFCNQILGVLTKQARDDMRTRRYKDFGSSQQHNVTWYNYIVSSTIVQFISNFWTNFKSAHRLHLFYTYLIIFQIILFIYNFRHYHHQSYPVCYCIAKGFGLNLRVLTLLVYLYMMRSTLNVLNTLQIFRTLLCIDYNIQIHTFVGLCILFHSLGHACMHIIYQSYFRDGGFKMAFSQKSFLNGASFENTAHGDAITGFILLASIILMSFTAFRRGMSSSTYSYFSKTHFLYAFWTVLVFIHVSHLWKYFISVSILFICDRIYDAFMLTIHSTLYHSRPCNNGVTFLSFPYAHIRRNNHQPGTYYRIKIPELSMTEWHPFSSAGSTSSHYLTFFVATAGDWTKRLHVLVSNPSLRGAIQVQIQGPYESITRDALNVSSHSTVLLIASGIGITPFFSVMATKVTQEYVHETDKILYGDLFQESLNYRENSYTTLEAILQNTCGFNKGNNNNKKSDSLIEIENNNRSKEGEQRQRQEECILDSMSSTTPLLENSQIEEHHVMNEVPILRVVWSIRDAVELMFYIDYVSHLVQNQRLLQSHVVQVDVYLTGLGKSADPAYMISQTLFLLSISTETSEYMKLHFGRLNVKKVIDNISPKEVYFCGGNALRDSLSRICYDSNITFHYENFDTATKYQFFTWSYYRKLWRKCWVFQWIALGDDIDETGSSSNALDRSHANLRNGKSSRSRHSNNENESSSSRRRNQHGRVKGKESKAAAASTTFSSTYSTV